MLLAQGHYPIQALVLDRPHEPLGIRVRIGRPERGPHNMHAGIVQQLSHVLAPLGVTITNQDAMGAQHTVRRSERRLTCRMNGLSGCGVDPTIWMRREARSITNTV